MSVPRWRLVRAKAFSDHRGRLAVLEGADALPFSVERVFYIHDVPPGAVRGAHAHRTGHQLMVCLAGSLEIALDDGRVRGTVQLSDPATALYIPPLIWATQREMAPRTAYFVLASAAYDERDYLRNYDDFLAAAGSGTH